jgi:uncharacterized protein YjbI with pentapeptide repeats
VTAETINSGNFGEIEWNDGYFKFCDFEGFSIEAGLVASDFVDCSFKGIDWYWGLFSQCNFINCKFTDCTFRGCSFPGTRFVDCKIVNCKFIQDNLGGECGFSGTVAYGCSVESSPEFQPEVSITSGG